MADPRMRASCAAGAIMMGALSLLVPAAWAIEYQSESQAPSDLVRVRQVAFGDIDLSDGGAAKTLDQRVRTAVNLLCERPAARTKRLSTRNWQSKCQDHAWNEARSQMSLALRLGQQAQATDQVGATAVPIVISTQ